MRKWRRSGEIRGAFSVAVLPFEGTLAIGRNNHIIVAKGALALAITPLMPVYPRSPVRPVRGEGVYLYGEEGERYLDFAAGIAVNILGHGHPHLTKAIQEQAATLIHVSNLYGSPQGEAFAKRLCDLTFADTVFFTNSGVEAVECAIKTARKYHHAKGNPHKHDLITFSNAFHGRTMAAISATDQAKMIDLKVRLRRSTRIPRGSSSSRFRARAASVPARMSSCRAFVQPVTSAT